MNNNSRSITQELVCNVHQRLRILLEKLVLVNLQKSGTALATQTGPVPMPLHK